MSADFWCWLPVIGLLPTSPDFMHRIDEYNPMPTRPPLPAIVRFVNDLLTRYPDLSATETETAWADGPMIGDASGGFINIGIRWDYYDKVVPFVTESATRDGLDCFDPQDATYYPVNGKPHVIVKYAIPEPVADAKAAIAKARRICALQAGSSGQWHAVLAGKYWHVWFGSGANGSGCPHAGAYLESNGGSASCQIAFVCQR